MEKLLPREIEVDIFSRLPAESLLPSKRVCKTWRGLFFDDNFIDVHLRRQSIGFEGKEDHPYYHKGGYSCSSNNEDDANTTSEVSFLILGDSHDKGQTKSFYYGNYSDEKQQFTCKKLKAESNNQLFTPDSNYSVVGSCNGLICLSTSHISNNLFVSNDPVCVCNPITGEALNLPNFIPKHQQEDQTTTVNIASGFGYVPLTNEYKVVRICYYRGTDRSMDWVPLRVQVCTLGSDEGWKTWKGDVKSLECLVFSDLTVSQGVYANGSLYWLNIQEDEEELTSIVVFDLAKEEFHSISPPPCSI